MGARWSWGFFGRGRNPLNNQGGMDMKRVKLLSLVLCVSMMTLGGCGNNPQTTWYNPTTWFLKGRVGGDYTQTDDFNKGKAAYDAKNYAVAIKLLSSFVEGNPLNIHVNEGALLMGKSAEKTQKYDLAVQAYSKVIDSAESPFDYKDSAYMGRGNSFFEMDRFKEALADYRTVETNYMTAENYNINPAEVKMKIELTKKMINSSPTK
jgi:hypothetical protein